jgi:predicted DNA-binding antitoxin AbrB/MazE fold protein
LEPSSGASRQAEPDTLTPFSSSLPDRQGVAGIDQSETGARRRRREGNALPVAGICWRITVWEQDNVNLADSRLDLIWITAAMLQSAILLHGNWCNRRFHNSFSVFGGFSVSITIKASYHNGVLQPDQPLPLDENEKVTVVVTRAESRIRAAAARLRFNADPELIRLVAVDPQLRFGDEEWNFWICRILCVVISQTIVDFE